eukprot:3317764-Prymnesium_polylepis.1
MPSPLSVAAAGGPPATFPVKRAEMAAEITKLTTNATASPFGHGGATVVDPAVRQAKQVMGSELVFAGGWDGQVPAEVLEKIRSELVPDSAAVTAKLHKVNVYEKGGHFADHRDTPRSETHFGSLVVLLP